jgi:hypothetical protein
MFTDMPELRTIRPTKFAVMRLARIARPRAINANTLHERP